MHLLSTLEAGAADVEEAVDLDLPPADIVVLSAADSDLAALAAAHAGDPARCWTLRLANWTRLGHPYSVDLLLEKTLAASRLVVVRLLGGIGYWRYGVERLAAAAGEGRFQLALLPGEGGDDPELARLSTVPAALRAELLVAFDAGGVDNARALLRRLARHLGRAVTVPPIRPLPRLGGWCPREGIVSLEALAARVAAGRPPALLLFYRALVQAGDLAAVAALAGELDRLGLTPLPVFLASLRDGAATAALPGFLARVRPEVVLNLTAFAAGGFDGTPGAALAGCDAPVLQLLAPRTPRATWAEDPRGLGPRDLAMQLVLPEVDGRIATRPVAFKETARRDPETGLAVTRWVPDPGGVAAACTLARNWVRLRRTPPAERRVALVLANYPARDGRLANGVGLDVPASAVAVLRWLAEAGYRVVDLPPDGDALMARLREGPTNALHRRPRVVRVALPLARYRAHFARLPEAVRRAVTARWGEPEADPRLLDGAFPLPVLPLGRVVVAIQPARGYERDPRETYHDPDLPPPHAYLAFYFWLLEEFGAQAVVHLGKHGNLEWLPGKAAALSESCFPAALLPPVPHLYPFIVNDPGEGSQAKRRTAAVVVDHLTPPLGRAGLYGELAELARLVDEYAQAQGLDPRRLAPLREEILDRSRALGLDRDLALDGLPEEARLRAIDNHLCELGELQIRTGLHVLGRSPAGEVRAELLAALVRAPRGRGEGGDAALPRALARDLELAPDPFAAEPAAPWTGSRPPALAALDDAPWRSVGDTLERLERLALELVAGRRRPEVGWTRTRAVLARVREELAPRLDACGPAEKAGLLAGLAGRRVPPGPSGAPTRGRVEVLPTGRNFFSVDPRTVPTPAAFALGRRAAEELVEHVFQTTGDWPRRIALSAWGTANMRTGGEDIAEALALLGCRPVWEEGSGRVLGVEVLPASVLGRPRVDVVLRVSGFFRDAFPAQIELLDDAVRRVAALDEPPEVNPLAAAARAEEAELAARGLDAATARRLATLRIFGSKPGAYGAGLQVPIDTGAWVDRRELAGVYLAWSGFAYGRGTHGRAARALLERRLAAVEAVVHNQDNREHDLLDSDDYYQFLGGLTAAVGELAGTEPLVLFGDHADPERPRVRRLQEEIGRVVRARAANPRWIRGMMRHGYKGAFEIAATVDYLFAFAATTRCVGEHHFDALFRAYVEDAEVRTFLERSNPDAFREILARFAEAIRRGLWRPRRNAVHATLDAFATDGGKDRREG